MKKYTLLFIILILGQYAFGQNSREQKLREDYSSAKRLYEGKQYQKALSKIEMLELSKGPLPAIVSLKVKALHDSGQYDKAQVALYDFFQYKGNIGAELYNEMLSYTVKVVLKLEEKRNQEINRRMEKELNKIQEKEDSRAWNRARSSNTFASYSQYLSDYPYGIFVSSAERKIEEFEKKKKVQKEAQAFQKAKSINTLEAFDEYFDVFTNGANYFTARKIQRSLEDQEAWQNAERYGSISGFYKYVDDFPNGEKIREANERIKTLDNYAYDEALRVGTQSALKNYLNNYTRGKYRNEIANKLVERIEFDTFQSAQINNSISGYKDYLDTYPSGKYVNEVNTLLGERYYQIGNQLFLQENWDDARDYYREYLKEYPKGKYIKQVKRKIFKCEWKNNPTNYPSYTLVYNQESPIGLIIRNKNYLQSAFGWYLGLRMKPLILDNQNRWSIDASGDHRSPYTSLNSTGVIKEGNATISVGLTVAPGFLNNLEFYFGGGGGYYPVYREFSVIGASSGGERSNVLFRDKELSKFDYFPEAGLHLNFSKLNLHYGVMYRDEIIHQFGIGIFEPYTIGTRYDFYNMFFLLNYDKESPFGITFGWIDRNFIGAHFNIKLNPEIFTFNVPYTIDNKGVHDSPYNSLNSTDNDRTGSVSLSASLTKRVLWRIWAYAGAGVAYRPVFEEYRGSPNTSGDNEAELFKNTDQSRFLPFPEGGCYLRLADRLLFNYGVSYREELIHQFGIGYRFF